MYFPLAVVYNGPLSNSLWTFLVEGILKFGGFRFCGVWNLCKIRYNIDYLFGMGKRIIKMANLIKLTNIINISKSKRHIMFLLSGCLTCFYFFFPPIFGSHTASLFINGFAKSFLQKIWEVVTFAISMIRISILLMKIEMHTTCARSHLYYL